MIAPTGVKYVHHFASQFDWAVYFESNGHGAFIFKPGQHRRIQSYIKYLEKHYGTRGGPFTRLTTLYRLLDSWFRMTNRVSA